MIQTATGKTLQPEAKILQRLRQSARITLELYVDVASHTSGYLSRLTPGSADGLSRANLALLQQKENKAYEACLKARDALLKYVLGESESNDTAGSP
jgi:hypothetical protein